MKIQYFKAAEGTDCDHQNIIRTEADCRAAGTQYGYPFKTIVNTFETDMHRPPGCFYGIGDRKSYLNMHFGDSMRFGDNPNVGPGGLCQTCALTTTEAPTTPAGSTYHHVTTGTCTDAGFHVIRDSAECQNARNALKTELMDISNRFFIEFKNIGTIQPAYNAINFPEACSFHPGWPGREGTVTWHDNTTGVCDINGWMGCLCKGIYCLYSGQVSLFQYRGYFR